MQTSKSAGSFEAAEGAHLTDVSLQRPERDYLNAARQGSLVAQFRLEAQAPRRLNGSTQRLSFSSRYAANSMAAKDWLESVDALLHYSLIARGDHGRATRVLSFHDRYMQGGPEASLRARAEAALQA